MELSKRLAAVAAMAESGDRLADIGTDHGYLPIYLIGENIISSAIAMDVVEGPLRRAAEHIRDHGLERKITLRKSDGFDALAPGEADAAVIAGMGGPLIIRILEKGEKVVRKLKYLILSPQSEIPQVRRYLLKNGFCIEKENMVLDEGKYYTVMKVRPQRDTGEVWSNIEEKYGKNLLQTHNPVLVEYLRNETEILKKIRDHLVLAGTERARERLFQVEKEISEAETALDMCKGGKKS